MTEKRERPKRTTAKPVPDSTPPSEEAASTPTVEQTKSGPAEADATPVNPPAPKAAKKEKEEPQNLAGLMARLQQLEDNQAELAKSKDDDDYASPTFYPLTKSQEVSQLPKLYEEQQELESHLTLDQAASAFGLSSADVSGYQIRGFDLEDAWLVVVVRESGEKHVQPWHG